MDLREKKHLLLLGMILLLLGMQPFVHGFVFGFLLFDVLAAVGVVVVLVVVFDPGHRRRRMVCIAAPAVVCNVLLHFVPPGIHHVLAVAYCALAVVFFGWATAVILRDAFQRDEIVADQLIAGLNGFLIAGVAWGNLYLLVYLLAPEAFETSDRVAALLADVHTRRFEFNHLSFATLTGLGYGDVVPTGRLACTLAWMEAAFSQFYIAVIIGLLVGLRMAGSSDAKKGSGDEAS